MPEPVLEEIVPLGLVGLVTPLIFRREEKEMVCLPLPCPQPTRSCHKVHVPFCWEHAQSIRWSIYKWSLHFIVYLVNLFLPFWFNTAPSSFPLDENGNQFPKYHNNNSNRTNLKHCLKTVHWITPSWELERACHASTSPAQLCFAVGRREPPFSGPGKVPQDVAWDPAWPREVRCLEDLLPAQLLFREVHQASTGRCSGAEKDLSIPSLLALCWVCFSPSLVCTTELGSSGRPISITTTG